MAQKYDLTDIGNALSRVMDNPMTKIIRSGSIGVLGVVNPVAGIVGGIGNDLPFTTTCDWCVYNRIFVSRTAEWGEMEEGVLDMSTYYYEANPASVLLDNINAARQTWNYG